MVKQGYGPSVYKLGRFLRLSRGYRLRCGQSTYIGLARSFAIAGAQHGINVNVLAPSARPRMHGIADAATPYLEWLFATIPRRSVDRRCLHGE